MTITKTTTLKCEHCGREASFTGERPLLADASEAPNKWYRIDPNYQQSVWLTSDFVIGGDFCSVECMRDYILEKIAGQDNPKPILKWEPDRNPEIGA